jgi:hypothetical protein
MLSTILKQAIQLAIVEEQENYKASLETSDVDE